MHDPTSHSPSLNLSLRRPLTGSLTLMALAGFVLLLSPAGCAKSAAEKGQSKATPAAKGESKQGAARIGQAPAARKSPAAATGNQEVAILAGGCFWGMEEILRHIDGVVTTDVGYAGGTVASPTYEQVSTGRSGHAESVRIIFDPSKLSYEELLTRWFFRMHDPTTLNRQGNDIGTQYRSAIFYTSPAQQKVAEAVKKRVDESGQWKAPIVTEIVAAGPFTMAEDYHQDYLQQKPDGYTCHFMREELEFPMSVPAE